MASVALPGGVVSMTAESAQRLLALGQGDAALLYVALLRYGGELPPARGALGWTAGRVDAAYRALLGAGLVAATAESPAGGERTHREAPDYVTGDILAALEGDGGFAALQAQVERILGSILSPADLKALYAIYDYMALPPEVILVLTNWCVEEMERKYGPGRRPRLSQIKKTAQRWRDSGVDTLEAAEEYLRRQSVLRSREAQLLPLVGVRDRAPLEREREYLATWLDWGFPPESVSLAYQKTLMIKQSMSWPYMNSILRNWHSKGLHSPAEIQRGDSGSGNSGGPGGRGAAAPGKSGEKSRRVAQDLADLKRAAGKEQ